MKKKQVKFSGFDWSLQDLEVMWDEVDKLGKGYGLNYSQPIMEVVTAEQMIDYSTTVGLPSTYTHWSYGKGFHQEYEDYIKGQRGLAYEMIINTERPIAYIMENNTLALQLLVLAHACVGHADFFKNNYLFKQYTQPETIVSFCNYAKDFVEDCETKLGISRVESILDAAHSLQYNGVDKYVRSTVDPNDDLLSKYYKQHEDKVENYNELYDGLRPASKRIPDILYQDPKAPTHFPEENILFFMEKYSPSLNDLEKELVRIVRYIGNYLFPQMRTKIMNEGWASFWHHTLMNDLYDTGVISEGIYLEAITNHCGVIHQQEHSAFNPYTLGFKIFKDIQRMCTNPTKEDLKYFPQLKGAHWLDVIKDIREDYIDTSFILQWLSPKVIRDLKMFTLHDDVTKPSYVVSTISDDKSYQKLKEDMSEQYNIINFIPEVLITSCDWKDTKEIHIRNNTYKHRSLEATNSLKVVRHLETLWGKGKVVAPGSMIHNN